MPEGYGGMRLTGCRTASRQFAARPQANPAEAALSAQTGDGLERLTVLACRRLRQSLA
jgi:hypothetical protein